MTLAENQAKADAKRMRDKKRKAKWRASIKGVASQLKADFPPGTKFDLKTKEGRSAYNRARYKKQKAECIKLMGVCEAGVVCKFN
jgi:hypothetical protein